MSANQKKPSSEAEKEWKRDETRRDKINRELQETMLKDPLDYKARVEVAFQAGLKFKREKWDAGALAKGIRTSGSINACKVFPVHTLWF